MNTVINKVENILTSEYTTSNFVEFVQEVFSNIEFVAPDVSVGLIQPFRVGLN